MMSGQTTVDKLWPEWADRSKGENYPQMLMKCYTLAKDNYKENRVQNMKWRKIHDG